jgi:recombination protein RecT
MTNEISAKPTASPVMEMLKSDAFKNAISGILDKKAPQFVASALSLVSQDKNLATADKATIYTALLTAASLDLPVNQNLGFAYIIGYAGKAQFQLGYKGFIQLAMRSGQFKTISVAEIYEGQILSSNPLTGYVFDFGKDVEKSENKIIGYASYFSLGNGFEKIFYMSIEELKKHGVKFSKSYNSKDRFGKDSSLWKTDFNSMAKKTVLKLLLSRFAPLSTEMQKGISLDQAVVREDGTPEYIDTVAEEPENEEKKRLLNFIEKATSIESLLSVEEQVAGDTETETAYLAKKATFIS